MKEFPKTIYVKIEEEREPEDSFFIANEDYTNLSESEENIKVAVYDLVTIKTAVNKTKLMD